jgi:hypothetical protein
VSDSDSSEPRPKPAKNRRIASHARFGENAAASEKPD